MGMPQEVDSCRTARINELTSLSSSSENESQNLRQECEEMLALIATTEEELARVQQALAEYRHQYDALMRD